MVITAMVFSFTDLDLRTATACWTPEPGLQDIDMQIDGEAIHIIVPVLSIFLVAGAFGFLSLSIPMARLRPYRIHAVFFLLVLAVGPGLFVNTLMKPVFGRPRPYQVQQFGGPFKYQPALKVSHESEGSAFACGDSSVGYALAAFYLIFLRKRKWLAWGSLGFATLLGSGIGCARMVIGRHFLSDVLWSAWVVFLVALVLYYFVMNIPAREQDRQS